MFLLPFVAASPTMTDWSVFRKNDEKKIISTQVSRCANKNLGDGNFVPYFYFAHLTHLQSDPPSFQATVDVIQGTLILDGGAMELLSRRRWRLVSGQVVICCVDKLQNNRKSLWGTITKFVWRSVRYKPPFHCTKKFNGRTMEVFSTKGIRLAGSAVSYTRQCCHAGLGCIKSPCILWTQHLAVGADHVCLILF